MEVLCCRPKDPQSLDPTPEMSSMGRTSCSSCCTSACSEWLWQPVLVLRSCASHRFALSSPLFRCQILRAFFNDVCRSYPELLQFWSQAAHTDAQLPAGGGRTLKRVKRRHSRRALTLSSPPSYMAIVCPGPIVRRAKVNHHASPEAHLPFLCYLATRPTADLPKLPHSSTSSLPPQAPPLGRRPTT